jgi:osmotically-inducible protein OsmY
MYGGDTSNYGNANQGGYDRGWWERTKDEVSSWFGDDDAERRRNRDQQQSGGYRGKGPKDYQRSEDRIREDVCDRLTDDDMLDATNINVQIQGNEVVLTGTVNSREQKRRAEDLVESISGVRNVENRIRVEHNDGRSDMR